MSFLKLATVGLLFSVFAQAAPKEIVIGFTPGGNAQTLRQQALHLAQDLQNEIKVPVSVYIAKSYEGLTSALKEKKIDFAFLTALTYVEAEKELQVKILLKKVWDGPFYYSVLLVPKKSAIRKLSDIKGQRIAFVDEKSTSGFLYPEVMLRKNGIEEKAFKQVRFSGSHASSVELLDNGEVDVIAVFGDDKAGLQNAYAKYGKKKNHVRVLWVSDPIPNDPFVVRADFYEQNPKLAHDVMFTLIDISERKENAKRLEEIMSAKGFLPATSRQYDPVREIARSLKPKGDQK